MVGVGGIGCPAAWALAQDVPGIRRLTLVDPDLVEPSNLPRQILFAPGDVGHPKALVAAARLAPGGTSPSGVHVVGVHARLDHETESELLEGVDVLVDATDGARTKDWINALAVRRRIPLVHAAGLRSEARLLDVPAGGRPCLACLFGRLEDELGSCADLGVWNGVVGVAGFLAAAAVARRLREPDAPSSGYAVHDFDAGRSFALVAEGDPACPVCAPAAELAAEVLPAEAAACMPSSGPEDGDALDLVGEECPMNLLRARAGVEALAPGGELEILLGAEGAETVPEGLAALGHEVVAEPLGPGLRIRVRRGALR